MYFILRLFKIFFKNQIKFRVNFKTKKSTNDFFNLLQKSKTDTFVYYANYLHFFTINTISVVKRMYCLSFFP